MQHDAKTQRKYALKRDWRYGENAAGKWVRSSAFREIDYDPENPNRLREFDNFDAAFTFDEECRLNGTGGRKAAHLPKPKDTVPKDQLALEKAVTHAVQEDGNKTRVELERVEDSPHGCHDKTHRLLREANANLDTKWERKQKDEEEI